MIKKEKKEKKTTGAGPLRAVKERGGGGFPLHLYDRLPSSSLPLLAPVRPSLYTRESFFSVSNAFPHWSERSIASSVILLFYWITIFVKIVYYQYGVQL